MAAEGKKNLGGRPRAFKSVEELEGKIKYYFDTITRDYPLFDMQFDHADENGKEHYIQVPRLNNAGEQVYGTEYFENPSVLGMCRHLGIHRDTLCEYEQQDGYSDTIKRAKLLIEEHVANKLDDKNKVVGAIFNLKNNFGWRDKQEVQVSGEIVIDIRLEDEE